MHLTLVISAQTTPSALARAALEHATKSALLSDNAALPGVSLMRST